MGLAAVLYWTAFQGGHLPRWVWWFIGADMVIGLPATIEFYSKYLF